MTVKIFAGRDLQERPWAPDYAHETTGTLEILKRLWIAFHHRQAVYAVISNLHDPPADMVILSERGLGVLELKHRFGRISIGHDRIWYADNTPIDSGRFLNPHMQVQAYAQVIRDRLLEFIRLQPRSTQPEECDLLKAQTAVCFTNPKAELDDLRKALGDARALRKPWETSFAAKTPDEIPEWAASLRFEISMGRARKFQPYELPSVAIPMIASSMFGGVEWDEILDLMPSGEPYGYLLLVEGERHSQIFSLVKDEIMIGRDPDECDVVLPAQFVRSSRIHARLIRQIDHCEIEDCGSRGGTYVNGQLLTERRPLLHGQTLTLGGPSASPKVCALKFAVHDQQRMDLKSTDQSDQA